MLRAARNEQGRVLIQVIDNGPGIDPAHLDNIFVPFFTTKRGGTGVGLSISRQLVQANRGFISVQPGEPDGTRVLAVAAGLAPARFRYRYVTFTAETSTRTASSCVGAAEDDAAQRRHIGEIPAPGHRDVVHPDEASVGGIEVDPAEGRAPHGHPRMRGASAHQRAAPVNHRQRMVRT